ncbi:MAG: MFS transporter [Candidatus Tokpelaia sp.]|uniref:MFS transporter n=1 Tax=Candidatus Tokpelaia sp. TaxID=2233777 RepID=UPI001239B6B6|nr:MFS transporter [Candidatus Tokpelaia sp.]KAA6204965.1 MAG: MFS transporter [Candidatus Tokpelaia sp.]KAA6207053.1 MAG: MFS transporter [Candidatus Tokpelaia sp.]KAA6405407.1 hypothetical protein DPQ22_04930 [Candidatus Tokpelaia sp.]
MRNLSKLKLLIFLEFAIWGAYLTTFGTYLIVTLGYSGREVGAVYAGVGLASLLTAFPVGILADKVISASRLYCLCHISGAVCLLAISFADNRDTIMVLFFINALFYVPTLSLSQAIQHYNVEIMALDKREFFPKVRICGTIGFVSSVWLVGLLQWQLTNKQFWLAAALALATALFSLTLPQVPIFRDKSGLLKLRDFIRHCYISLKTPKLLLFFIFCVGLGAALQINNTFANTFLHDIQIPYFSIFNSFSQASSIVFAFPLIWFLKRFSVKLIIAVSMAAWAARFLLFAYGSADRFSGLLLLACGVLIYGIAYDFFMMTGSIFVDREVNKRMRAFTQTMYLAAVNGLGMIAGNILSGWTIDSHTVGGVRQWHEIWLIFAFSTLAMLVLFLFFYRGKPRPEQEKAELPQI